MAECYQLLAVVLLINFAGGLYRVYRGPEPADRMLAVQLFGSSTVAIVLLLAEALALAALRDVALVFTLLAIPAIVAFIRVPLHPSGAARRTGKERS